MTQTSLPAGTSGPARSCTACGGPLPGPVPRCPRCGAVITAGGKARRSSSAIVIAVVVVALFAAIPCLGVVAAIAIPNFIRYQLRAKEAGVKAELAALAKAERSTAERTGRYVPLGPLPAGEPGRAKLPLSADERQVAGGVDWLLEPATYGQYRVAVAEDDSGRQVASLCAESDLDGDGVRAVYVVFLPLPGGGAPPAPCTTPVEDDARYEPGQVIKISEPNVF